MLTHWHPRRAIYDALKRGFLTFKVPRGIRSVTPIDLPIKAHSMLQFNGSDDDAKPTPCTETNWALRIKDRKIVALGPHAEIAAEHQASATLELPNYSLMPGLINLQSHALGIIDRGDSRGVDVFPGPWALSTHLQPFSLTRSLWPRRQPVHVCRCIANG